MPEQGLPVGVASLKDWGRTVVTSGQYTGCSYQEIADGTTEAHESYRKWTLQRYENSTADPKLVDLGKFLVRYLARGQNQSGPIVYIPGTTIPRQLK